MQSKTRTKASAEPSLPATPASHATEAVIQPASNASQPLEKSRVRQKATADQATIQRDGADALPVSDYPLKAGPAANTLDRRERLRARNDAAKGAAKGAAKNAAKGARGSGEIS